MPNVPGGHRPDPSSNQRPLQRAQRPAGTRFRSESPSDPARQGAPQSNPYARSGGFSSQSSRPGGSRFAQDGDKSAYDAGSTQGGVAPAYSRRPQRPQKSSPIPVIVGVVAAIAVIAIVAVFVFPMLFGKPGESVPTVEPGQPVTLTIPEGASGDTIASILSEEHVIEEPKTYYATVKKLQAEMSLKPGDYSFVTGQDPVEVVKQLVEGPNVEGVRLTVPEGKTVEQTAAIVEESLGIAADEFLALAKASNYAEDYPFVADAYDDSLEGFLFPKTYDMSKEPTADEVIRKMLDQFEREVMATSFAEGANGLSAHEILSLAALIERETAVPEERPIVASVIYNRLDIDMPLQIDAAIVYARGGGNGIVTYDDLEIDSPYNVYKNLGLTPGPICSPSLSSIEAALQPDDTDYIYYVASPKGDGSHRFTSSDTEFTQWADEYHESIS